MSRHNIRIDRSAEIVSMMIYTGLHAVPLFAILPTGFTAYRVRNTRGRHQIALVGSINKHFTPEFFTRKSSKGNNPVIFHLGTRFPVKPFIPVHFYIMFTDKIFEYFFGHAWFKCPHCLAFPIHGHGTLPSVTVFRLFLPCPCRGIVVMQPNPVVKLAGEAPDSISIT